MTDGVGYPGGPPEAHLNRPLLFSSLLLSTLTGCVAWHPVDLYPMSRPIAPGYVEGERKKVSDCNFVLFQLFEFGNGAKMSGMLEELGEGADGVVEITLDQKRSNYILWGFNCYTMWGTPVRTGPQDAATGPSAPPATWSERMKQGDPPKGG